MKEMGVQQDGVRGTVGCGPARANRDAFEAVLAVYPLQDVSGHFHDTYGQALANVYACLEMGISTFDASVAGLGGCPFARGATGNVATEDVLYLLNGLQIETGVDMTRLVQIRQWVSGGLGRKAATRAGNAINARATQAGEGPKRTRPPPR